MLPTGADDGGFWGGRRWYTQHGEISHHLPLECVKSSAIYYNVCSDRLEGRLINVPIVGNMMIIISMSKQPDSGGCIGLVNSDPTTLDKGHEASILGNYSDELP